MDHRTTPEGGTINRSWLPSWLTWLTGAAILVALACQVGADSFLKALDGIGIGAVLAALAITAYTTWCSACRWSLLAHRLHVGLSLASACRAYYRAQFLNATLPGGVVGEVDRAIWHGHSSRAMAKGIQSVLWDRISGQVVLFGLVLITTPVLAPSVRIWMLWMLGAAAIVVLVAYTINSRLVRAFWAEVRDVPAAPGVWAAVLLLSTLAIAGHVTVFIVAARSVGVTAPTLELVPLGLVILQASAIPLGPAGWGPREGAATLVFSAAGLGASAGLAVSVAYGVLATLATLPGALALRRRQTADPPASGSKGGPSWASAPSQS